MGARLPSRRGRPSALFVERFLVFGGNQSPKWKSGTSPLSHSSRLSDTGTNDGAWRRSNEGVAPDVQISRERPLAVSPFGSHRLGRVFDVAQRACSRGGP